MKNTNHITYGKGLQDKDHVWYLPSSAIAKLEEIKKPEFDLSEVDGAVGLGEVSEEGIAKTPGYGDLESVKNQGGSPVVYSDGDYEPAVALSLMQTAGDIEVDKVVYGASNVKGTAGNYTINENAKNKTRGIFVIDSAQDNGGLQRTIYPDGILQLSDDVVDNYTDVRVYPVTITPSIDKAGNAAYTTKTAKVEG